MTREEAVKWLKDYLKNTDLPMPQYEEAVNMAINALHREQQFLDAGYKNGRVEFNIGGRKFMVKELAQ